MADNQQIICVTTDEVPGRNVAQVLGLVWGIGITNDHGNPRHQFEAADAARHEAYNNLMERALSMGANAIIGVAADSFVARDENAVDREYTIYGTAVVLE
jgi:uncharacterized protein YbjQ (UPF0145 family)